MTNCRECIYHVNDKDKETPTHIRCHHPLAEKLINIPGMINNIFDGQIPIPHDMYMILDDEVTKEDEEGPNVFKLMFFFPLSFDPKHITECGVFNDKVEKTGN